MVRQRSAKPSFASSNLAGTSICDVHFWCRTQKVLGKVNITFYMRFLMAKCLKSTGKMLTRIFGFPLMQLPFQKRLEPFKSAKEAICAAPFLISDRISKRALLFYRVFRKLSFVNLPGFLWRDSHKKPGFFFFKKGADSQQPFLSRSPFSGRAAFLFS